MALKAISLQLDVGLLERLDAARGDVPRQRFVGRLLEGALPEGGLPDPPEGELVVTTTEQLRAVADEVSRVTGHKAGCGCNRCDEVRHP